MYQEARLVHADLSEFNMLYVSCVIQLLLFILVPLSWLKADFSALDCRYHDGDAYIIDVSQSVEHDHPHALEFLRKDCSNVNGECDENIYWIFI